jgi:hypothetical protein
LDVLGKLVAPEGPYWRGAWVLALLGFGESLENFGFFKNNVHCGFVVSFDSGNLIKFSAKFIKNN